MTPLLAPKLPSDPDRSFERLYRRHVRDVYGFALGVLGNPADAEDVTQTTFLNAYRAMSRGDRVENPRGWLLRIAQNVCRQRFRTASRRPQEVQLDAELAEAFVDDEAPAADEIRAAMLHLAFNQRTVLVLREIEGRSYAEIAETMGISIAAVETLLFRARRALREQLEAAERPISCDAAELYVSRSIDKRLSRHERGRLRAHLRACPACATLARSQRAQSKALARHLSVIPLPAGLAAALGWSAAAKAAAVVTAAAVVGTGVAVGSGAVPAPWAGEPPRSDTASAVASGPPEIVPASARERSSAATAPVAAAAAPAVTALADGPAADTARPVSDRPQGAGGAPGRPASPGKSADAPGQLKEPGQPAAGKAKGKGKAAKDAKPEESAAKGEAAAGKPPEASGKDAAAGRAPEKPSQGQPADDTVPATAPAASEEADPIILGRDEGKARGKGGGPKSDRLSRTDEEESLVETSKKTAPSPGSLVDKGAGRKD